jgi:hypothetical protein
VDAYLDIESLRFGGRLEVERTIGPGSLKVLVPPFSFQPLVENAIEHGLRSLPGAGRLRLVIRATGPWLEMNVTDDGQGVPSTEVESEPQNTTNPLPCSSHCSSVQERLVTYWKICGCPGDPVYLLTLIHGHRARKVCHWHGMAELRRLRLRFQKSS